MFRRILITGAAVLAAGTVAIAPAAAQDGGGNYGGCSATVSDSNVQPGQSVTVSGSGAAVDGAVSASLDGTVVGTGTADAQGDFSFSVTIPASASGNETLTVSCGANRGTDALVLGVGSDLLPATGTSSTFPMAQTGVAALALGAAALGAARVRKARAESASL